MLEKSEYNKQDKQTAKIQGSANRLSSGEARKGKLNRSGSTQMSQEANDSETTSDITRVVQHPREMQQKSDMDKPKVQRQKKSDLKDKSILSVKGKANKQQSVKNKPESDALHPNIDLNEVTPGSDLQSPSDPDDGAPEENFQWNDDFIAQLDDEDENYTVAPMKPTKRARSVEPIEKGRNLKRKQLIPSKNQRLNMIGEKKRERSDLTSAKPVEDVNIRLARLEKLLRLQALRNLEEHLSEDEDDERLSDDEDESGDDIPPRDEEEMSDDDDDEDRDNSSESEEERSERHSRRSRTQSTLLTAKGKAAKEVLQGHFGELDKFHPMTHSISRGERSGILKGIAETEPFFPRIKRIEIPFKYSKWSDKDKERKLYKQICRLRDIYEVQMTTLYDIMNGGQTNACRHLLQTIDLTLDAATTANLERLSLRSGPSVVQSIKHAEDEAVLQDPYKAIISAKAKEAHELQTMADKRLFQPAQQSLRKWGTLRRGWDSRSPRSGWRGRRDSSQSNRFYSGGTPPYGGAPPVGRTMGPAKAGGPRISRSRQAPNHPSVGRKRI
jgi:hypothetical protein